MPCGVTNRTLDALSTKRPSGRVFVYAGWYKELIGAPHNIVRHPHMPQAAFADLWATIKRGHPWEGVVKDRTKSGDFYWVSANVTPVVENGKVIE